MKVLAERIMGDADLVGRCEDLFPETMMGEEEKRELLWLIGMYQYVHFESIATDRDEDGVVIVTGFELSRAEL